MIPILSGLPSRRRITPSTALWVHTATVGVTWVNLWTNPAIVALEETILYNHYVRPTVPTSGPSPLPLVLHIVPGFRQADSVVLAREQVSEHYRSGSAQRGLGYAHPPISRTRHPLRRHKMTDIYTSRAVTKNGKRTMGKEQRFPVFVALQSPIFS